MSEEETRCIVQSIVGAAAVRRLEALATLVIAENQRQNLIAQSTIDSLWARHILDSVQLKRFAGKDESWLDIGTGGGFPGLAIAAADPGGDAFGRVDGDHLRSGGGADAKAFASEQPLRHTGDAMAVPPGASTAR